MVRDGLKLQSIDGQWTKGKAMEHAVGTYENNQWKYLTLTVKPEGSPVIDLNTPP